MEVVNDASALCESGVGGTGSGRKVLLWEGEVITMKRKEVLIAVIAGCFGAVITMGVGLFIPVGVVAQSQPTDAEFETITCGRLRVVDGKGNALVDLYNNGLGGSADFYDLKGDVMMRLKSEGIQSRIRLFHKKDFHDVGNRNPPILGIDIDTNSLNSFLEVGNISQRGAVRMHNTDGFSDVQPQSCGQLDLPRHRWLGLRKHPLPTDTVSMSLD